MKQLSIIGWIILLALLYFFSKSKFGYNAIYFSLVLILVLLLVGNYQTINKVMLVDEN